MKNMIAVLIVLFLSIPAFAQENAVGYGLLNSYLKAEKNDHGLLLTKNNAPLDGKRFIKLYNKQHPANKKSSRRITFMDGPVVFSSTPVEVSGSPNPLTLRPATLTKEPSTALEALGLAAGFAAGFVAPALSKNYIPIEPTPIQAYLQSTYRQHQ